MIYLDVTSSCKSPMSTGVQQVVRRISRELNSQVSVTPILWNNQLCSYCWLGDIERCYLSNPFHHDLHPRAIPEQMANPFPWSKAWRFLRHFQKQICWEKIIVDGDVFLAPEIFQDRRLDFFQSHSFDSKLKKVAIFHDAINLKAPAIASPERQKRFDWYTKSLAKFDKVICVSRESESDLNFFWKKFNVSPTQTCVETWPPCLSPKRIECGSNFNSKRVLCVSTLERRKNHILLLEAAEKVWNKGINFQLILIGRTTTHWGMQVIFEIEKLAKKGHPIQWLKHVNDDTLIEEYSKSTFTVYPSLVEGFGLPILESLNFHRPCICGKNGALGEVSQGGGCYWVDQTSVTALAEAIEKLINDTVLYQQLVEGAKSRSFRTWENYIMRLLSHLKRTTEEH